MKPSRKKIPRKGSEEYFDRQCRISTATSIIEDTWLYEWTSHPPEELLRRKTEFHILTPLEVTKNQWTVLVPAAREVARIFRLQKPEALNDLTLDAELRAASFEWLSLNRYPTKPCLMGVCGEYIIAAAHSSQKRQDFVPIQQWSLLQKCKDLAGLRYRSKFRFFCAKTATQYSFTTERQGLGCEVSYRIDVGVHGLANLWAVLKIDGTYVPTPYRTILADDLSNLPEKAGQLNQLCREYVQALDWAFLRAHGGKAVYSWLRKEFKDAAPLGGVWDSLRKERQLAGVRTKLDGLLTVMKSLHLKSEDAVLPLIPLAQRLSATGGAYA